MAQKSIHILNKNGYSMFWNSMWDDKVNFSKSFKKQIFLNFFFTFLIQDYNSYNFFLKNKFFLKKYSSEFNSFRNDLFYKTGLLKNYFQVFDFKYNTNIFNSQVWFFRYQTWFIIFLLILDLKKNSKNRFTQIWPDFSGIVKRYSLNLFLLNFEFKSICSKNNYYF